ncbi:ABC-type transport system involved in multi-copper enzyme maturation permease subunit [Salana multivorans]|uniref:ABC-type transport system involved in multi-copper enzyme maturation permease subunit n=1 Tax=Salana multivorans TaxID=120377 RepID=A0A3N2DA37_9MICO|nr:ABC-type transport system involved in multi-copper enzyme maturation permease subunit [Salana multivorans]
MSTHAAGAPPVGMPSRVGVTFARAVASEWFKVWGLRSTRVVFAVSVLLTPALALIGASDPNVPADGYGTLAYWVVSLTILTQFPLLLLGVLLGSGETANRSAASTFVAVPTRTPALLARTVVTITTSTAAALLSLGLAAAVTLTTGLGRELSTELTPETTRMWLGTSLYLVAATTFCFGLGLLVGRTVLAVLATFAIFILDLATIGAPGALTSITAFLPGHAASAVTSSEEFLDVLRSMDAAPLDPWANVAITIGWAGAAVLAGIIRTRRRDV